MKIKIVFEILPGLVLIGFTSEGSQVEYLLEKSEINTICQPTE